MKNHQKYLQGTKDLLKEREEYVMLTTITPPTKESKCMWRFLEKLLRKHTNYGNLTHTNLCIHCKNLHGIF